MELTFIFNSIFITERGTTSFIWWGWRSGREKVDSFLAAGGLFYIKDNETPFPKISQNIISINGTKNTTPTSFPKHSSTI